MVKKVLKWTGIVVFAGLLAMMVYAFLGKNQTLNLEVEAINLEKIADGAYTGSYDCYRWSNTVEVTVKDHRISSIRVLKAPAGRTKISKELTNRILDRQKTDVDVISGVTADSKAFLKAVEDALSVKKK